MDYDETVRALDSVVGKFVIVYSTLEPPDGDEPRDFGDGLAVWGVLERDQETGAEGRRHLSQLGTYAKIGRAELDLGDAPLEL